MPTHGVGKCTAGPIYLVLGEHYNGNDLSHGNLSVGCALQSEEHLGVSIAYTIPMSK